MNNLLEPDFSTECGSVTTFLNQAKQGESFAQHQLWNRYLQRLLVMASRRLEKSVATVVSADDIASIVFHEFLKGLNEGRFRRLENRKDLWQVLVMLTQRKSADSARKALCQKRSVERTTPAGGVGPPIDEQFGLVSDQPSPEQVVLLEEEFDLRLRSLDDKKLQTIALAKMSGFSNQEIAQQLDCSVRSIERKLSIIRRRWTD